MGDYRVRRFAGDLQQFVFGFALPILLPPAGPVSAGWPLLPIDTWVTHSRFEPFEVDTVLGSPKAQIQLEMEKWMLRSAEN